MLLPESLYLASFVSVFPREAKTLQPGLPSLSPSLAAMQIRLRSLLSLAEFLDGTEAVSFSFSEETGLFQGIDPQLKEENRERARPGNLVSFLSTMRSKTS